MLKNVLFLLLLSACGTNVFKAAEPVDPAADATIAIEENRPQDAIDILTSALEDDPQNYQYLSLLASAQAQLAGVDLIAVLLKMATSSGDESDSSSSTEGGDNSITKLFVALPEATDENIAGLNEAISTLESIPADARTEADNYKMTVFYTSRMGLTTKKFDKDGDGVVTPVELLDLGDADATSIISNLAAAEAAVAASDGSDSTSASAEQLSSITAAIEASEGDSDAEKLRSYLGGT